MIDDESIGLYININVIEDVTTSLTFFNINVDGFYPITFFGSQCISLT